MVLNNVITYFQMDRRKYPCGVCNKSYSQKSKPRFHEKNVHEASVAETTCRICDKHLASTQSRKRHEAIVHGSVKPFQCEICNSSFSVKSNLEGHKRSTHGEETLKCQRCQSEFCYAFSLNEHKKKCESQNPNVFVCPVCDKRFKHECSMRAHDQSAHSGNLVQTQTQITVKIL